MRSAVGILIVAGALLACKKREPEAVCKHVLELAKKKSGKNESNDYPECVGRIAKIKAEHPEKYDEFAKCVLDADNLETAKRTCDPD